MHGWSLAIAVCLTVASASAAARKPPVDLLPRQAGDDQLQWLVVAPERAPQAPDALRAHCAESPGTCTFEALGAVAGRQLYYLLERDPDPVPEAARSGRTVLFDESAATEPLRPLLEVGYDLGVRFGQVPELHHTPYGVIVVLPIAVPGTGHFNEDILLLWKSERWLQIDSQSWMQDLRLPPCYGVWKGQRVDLRTWKMTTGVWVEGDGNCCPSGGEVAATLELRARAVRVKAQHATLVPIPELRQPWREPRLKDCLNAARTAE